MENIVLLIKSFRPDFNRVSRLLLSIEKHNVDAIPLYLAVNDNDYKFFRKRICSSIQLLRDSDIIVCNIKDGWRYQQVVKAQFHLMNICENYLCLDSDSVFINDFRKSDFMFDALTPYTIMHESKSFMETMEILGHDSSDLFRHKAIKSVRDRFETHGKYWDYGPSPYIWSTTVWRHFQEHYLYPQGYTFESFFTEMEASALPSEAIIYGEYLLKTRMIDIVPIECLFKVYHYKEQFELEAPHFDLEKLKKNYLGIIKQSNWDIEPQPKNRFLFWK